MYAIEKVGTIIFGNHRLDVYDNVDEPLFKAVDVARLIDYSIGNTWKMLEVCETDEKLQLPVVVAGQRRNVNFVTELGLYNVLSQSRKPIARQWRRVVHNELINMRRDKDMNVVEKFEEWDNALDSIYWDEETGELMQTVTVRGGDVVQVPFNE